MSFDLSKLEGARQKQEDGVPVAIKHPATGADLGITITIASYESERVKRVAREMANRAMMEAKRNPRRGDTVEAIEERTIAIAAAAIIDWKGIEMDGKPLPFTRDNAKMLLEKFPFIGEQLDAAAGDRSLFFAD
jgi:hypothetical protein